MLAGTDEAAFWEPLVSEATLGAAIAECGREGGALVKHLLRKGVSEQELYRHLRSSGFTGPSAGGRLRGLQPPRLAVETSLAHLALPVEETAGGFVTAMADPSEPATLRLLERILGRPVLPLLVPADELVGAITRSYQELPEQEDSAGVRSGAPRNSTPRNSEPGDRGYDGEYTPAVPNALQVPLELMQSNPLYRHVERVVGDPGPRPPPPELAPLLSELSAHTDRNAVLRLACSAAAGVGRLALFLARRGQALQGREGIGAGVTRDKIRGLWLPLGQPSLFRQALHSFSTYRGPHGATPVDCLFRAALAGTGGELILHPMHLSGRVLGLLCVDGARYQGAGVEHTQAIGAAVVAALQRIISKSKKVQP